eukprot:313615_1
MPTDVELMIKSTNKNKPPCDPENAIYKNQHVTVDIDPVSVQMVFFTISDFNLNRIALLSSCDDINLFNLMPNIAPKTTLISGIHRKPRMSVFIVVLVTGNSQNVVCLKSLGIHVAMHADSSRAEIPNTTTQPIIIGTAIAINKT